MMTTDEIKDLFMKSGALMEGHFKLTSGLHSPQYVNKFNLLSKPKYAAPLFEEMASRWQDKEVGIVVGPAVGGIILSYEIARHLNINGIFLERKNGAMTLSRGFKIRPGQRVLVVEDVVTTGASVKEVCDVVTDAGGDLIGISLMVDRSGGKASFDIETDSLLTLDLETYDPDDCPLCNDGTALSTLGSTGKK
ncbi:orotate phosphoribosyltransferase [Candidatus Marinimicrobia bacterium MT.SAG.4]|nr:orotate phosphoribosyltransferase [Candidatus Marinimicrobia bacterium MT.SAG.4]